MQGNVIYDGVTGQYFVHTYGNSVNESDKVNEEGCLKFFAYEIDESTLCQCTSLKDKNYKLIWENDLVKCGGQMFVSWNEQFASWCLTRKGWLYNHFFGESQEPEECEVVGNRFDNPELLEVEERSVRFE